MPGGIQDQSGCGSGQPALVVGNPAHGRGVENDDLQGPLQPTESSRFTFLQL